MPVRRRLRGAAAVGALLGAMVPVQPSAGDSRNPADWRTPGQIVPLTTSARIDRRAVDVRSRGALTFGFSGGGGVTGPAQLDGITRLDQTIEERLKGGVYERRQREWYFAVGTTPRRQTVTTHRQTAQDIFGFRLRLAIAGGCAPIVDAPGELCSFTPALATDPAFYDALLIPTRFLGGANFGDRITPETYEALQGPGFVRSAPGEPPLGLDLDIRNAGLEPSRSRADLNAARRSETNRRHIVPSLVMLDQRLYSNATDARVARTLRGAVFLHPEDWTGTAAATQLLGLVLPRAGGRLPGLAERPNFQVNNNLFLAANNAWTPANSFVVYHAGVSHVRHPEEPVSNRHELPAAWFHGIWLGFSPVSERRVVQRQRLETTAPRNLRVDSFAQGGSALDSGLGQVSGLIELVGIDGDILPISLEDIALRHTQLGLAFSDQEGVLHRTSTTETTTRLVPHLVLTGNRTTSRSVVRYYGGAIFGETSRPNLHLGGDLRISTENGLGVALGGAYFSRPDREYFSRVSGSISKRFELEEGRSLVLGVSANYNIDRPDVSGLRIDDERSRVDLSATYRREDLRVTLRHTPDGLLPGSIASSTSVGLSWAVNDRLRLSGEVTPLSEQSAYTAARLGLSWRVAEAPDAASLRLSWRQDRYLLGRDPFGKALRYKDQVFTATLQQRF